MERSFGLLSQIDNLSIIRDAIMEDRSLQDSEKFIVLFKCFFTLCLLKSNEDEINLLHEHVTGEIYALGYEGISINYSVCDTNAHNGLFTQRSDSHCTRRL